MNGHYRHAEPDDIEFIYSLILEGSRDGHYASWLIEPEQAKALKVMVIEAVENASITRFSERGVERVQTVTVIYLNEDGKRAGFLIASEKIPGSKDTDIELYKCSVAKPFRRRGYARTLINHFITTYPGQIRFHARCYKKSTFMISLLKSLGFKQSGVSDGGTILLEKPV